MIQLYLRHQGNMDTITASVLCFTRKDEPRICSIIQAAIDGGEVKEFAAFTQESSKKKKARRRRVRAWVALEKKQLMSDESDLPG